MTLKIPKLQLNTKQIALAGIFLSLLTAFKLLDIAMPRINDNAIWELYYTVGALSVITLPWSISVLVLFAAPFLWLAIGQVTMNGPYSFIFDYMIPLIGLQVIKLSLNRFFSLPLVLVSGLIKFFSHTISGKLFWETPWWASMVYNFPFTAITVLFTMVIVFLLFNKVRTINTVSKNHSISYYISTMTKRYIQEYTFLQKGYLNKTVLFEIDSKKWIMKISNSKASTLENEFLVSRIFYPESILSVDKKALLRPFVEGKRIKELNEAQKKDLALKIKALHKIQIPNLPIQNWTEFNKFRFLISSKLFKRFQLLVDKYANEPLVSSHNDINVPNMIQTSENSVELIDFEWARMNHELFDYASYYVYENQYILKSHKDDESFNDFVFMIRVFGLLWTYSIPLSIKAYRIRQKFRKDLK